MNEPSHNEPSTVNPAAEIQPALASPRISSKQLALAAVVISAVTLTVRMPFLSAGGFPADQFQNVFWSERTHTEGMAWVYAPRPDGSGRRWCNYPPGYLYVLKGLAGMFEWFSPDGTPLNGEVVMDLAGNHETPSTRVAVWLYKLPAVGADMLLAIGLLVWLTPRTGVRIAGGLAILYALMPAVIHNSAIWGQVDAVPTLLMVASLEMARRRRVLMMVALAMLATLTKAQACILVPVWAVVAIQWMGTNLRRWASLLGLAAAILLLVMLPFGGVLDGVWASYADAARYYPFTHLNGFSAWFLDAPLLEPQLGNMGTVYSRDDVPVLLGLAPRTLGLIGVFATWGLASVVLWRDRCGDRSMLWAARLLPVAFFVLATQMHERYLFPAIALWVWAFVRSPRWWIGWLLLNVCVAMNVFWAWAGPTGVPWVTWCQGVLHQTWLGFAPGCWCAGALLIVLALTIVGWVNGFPSSRGTDGLAASNPTSD